MLSVDLWSFVVRKVCVAIFCPSTESNPQRLDVSSGNVFTTPLWHGQGASYVLETHKAIIRRPCPDTAF